MSKSKPIRDPYGTVLRAAFLSDSALAAALMRSNKRDLAERALRGLTRLQEKVLRERFDLMTPEAKKRLGDTSVAEMLPRERIRDVEVRALLKLRRTNQSRRPPVAS